ncbi:hypothetical protein GLE_3339 [Lysobacter enzymogenes]|uniref:Uncharacterized protein n=1 Tax=Lysobacter enzymogenes TaxID=69 RepID=A0A0S2DJV9_LYSEN|nr:hypothetical protein GLE_3339 [Lysobacter enzymogenes]
MSERAHRPANATLRFRHSRERGNPGRHPGAAPKSADRAPSRSAAIGLRRLTVRRPPPPFACPARRPDAAFMAM